MAFDVSERKAAADRGWRDKSKITMTGALHDCLRPGGLRIGTKARCHAEIRTAYQQEP
jgi:hypothetical protein